MQIHKEVAQTLDRCIKYRQELHKIPEVAYEEIETSSYLRKKLETFAPDKLETLVGTGIKAVFMAKDPISTIAFRADMDALDITELRYTEYTSLTEGKMHSCGHDGHMAMLLVLADLISKHRDNLKHNVVLLFQPAEEGKGGAKRMVEEGALKSPDVDKIYGFHLWPDIPKGKLGIRWGPMMAKTCEFDVTVRGVSAHGASPQKGVDAIVSASAFITLLQSTITRNLDPHHDALLTIGKITGGTARNIIADEVVLNGTLRVMNQDVFDQLLARLSHMANGLAMATGARYEIRELMEYPCVDNPRDMVEDFYRYIDMDDVILTEPVMAAEDFSFYQEEVPGIFIFLGIAGGKNNAPLHNQYFDFDEDALLYGIEVYCRILGLLN